jgi:hypothetical protein
MANIKFIFFCGSEQFILDTKLDRKMLLINRFFGVWNLKGVWSFDDLFGKVLMGLLELPGFYGLMGFEEDPGAWRVLRNSPGIR